MTTQHIEATGVGPTLQGAIDNAIRQAIEEVNGKSVSGGGAQWSGSGTFDADGGPRSFSSSAYADWLSSHTAGAVTHFQVLSQKQNNHPVSSNEQSLDASRGESWNRGKVDASAGASAESGDTTAKVQTGLKGDWDQRQGAEKVVYKDKHTEYGSKWVVRIAADVATYKEAAEAKLTRVVVAFPRANQSTFHVGDSSIPAQEIAVAIRAKLTDALTQSHRFTVLDRGSSQEIGQEIELIQSGAAKPSDTARLGQQLATDLIVIPTIDRFEYLRHERALRLTDRTLASYSGGGALSFKVVNATTGQIIMSQSFDYALPATTPTTLGASANGPKLADEMMSSLDGKIVAALLQSTYPLSVVTLQGRSVVLNQGGAAVMAGVSYQAVMLGKEVFDPQSGVSLGPTESPCCTIAVDRVTPTLSYGHVVEPDFKLVGAYVPGSIELREPVVTTARVEPRDPHLPTAPRGRSAAPVATKAPPIKKVDTNW